MTATLIDQQNIASAGTRRHSPDMASTYRRSGSRFIWLKYRDPLTGKTVRRSTKIVAKMPDAKREAKKQKAHWDMREASAPIVRERERWTAWAGEYIQSRYGGTGSLKNANIAWRDMLRYFTEIHVVAPRQVNHEIAAGFAPWLIAGDPDDKEERKLGANTARQRFIYFTVLMSEAVRRGFADSNPCREVDVRGVRPKEKLEISEEHIKEIEKDLLTRPEWMRDQWVVLMRQGCRIAETNIPLSRIDTKAMTLTLKIKGGRFHTVRLHADILPMAEKATAAGRKTLLSVENVGSWAAIWSVYFKNFKREGKEPGLPYSAHCTRVTAITRLARAGHSIAQICSFIGHTAEVNKIYRKLRPDDSSALMATLGAASSPE